MNEAKYVVKTGKYTAEYINKLLQELTKEGEKGVDFKFTSKEESDSESDTNNTH